MVIKQIKLKNFRNYIDSEFKFDDKLNIIIGKNAQGKTNILEGIFFAVLGKSFRTSKEKEVIRWNCERGSIKAYFSKKYRDVEIEFLFDKEHKKTVKIDNIPIHKIGELLCQANAVFFSPDELKLIKESPEERRRFMNIDISQTNKKYFYTLGRYEKVLQNRNKLLKSSTDINVIKQTIDIWDRALSELGEKIFIERKKFIEDLAPYASLAHEYISSGKEKLEAELKDLKLVKRPEVIKRIKVARSYGDLSENSEYDAAKDEQSHVEDRISQVEEMLKYAQVVDADAVAPDEVAVGKTVTYTEVGEDDPETYTIVGSERSNRGKHQNTCV